MSTRSDLRRPTAIAIALTLLATIAAWAPGTGTSEVRAAEPTPVARWTFDDGSGSTAEDGIGSLDGTLVSGASWVTSGTAQGDGAIHFDGVDDAVTIPTSAALEGTSFTVILWARSSDLISSSSQPIVQKNFYGCDVGSSWSIDQNFRTALMRVLKSGYASSTGPSANEQVATWDGEWHEYAMVVDGSSGIVEAWVDGRWTSSSFGSPLTLEYGASGRTDDHLRIGSPGADCPYKKPFHGDVDDIRIYESALTEAQVLAEMPVFSTTTTVNVQQSGETATVLNDTSAAFVAGIDPAPASGDTEFWLSKNGAPETLFTTSSLNDSSSGHTFATVAPGALEPGSYSLRVKWLGASNWLASTSPTVAFSVIRRPVVMTLDATPTDDVPGGGSTLTAKVMVEDPPSSYVIGGSIEFYDVTGGGDVLVGTSSLAYVGDPHWNQASIGVSGLATGVHTYEARFAGTSTLASAAQQATVTIGKQLANPTLYFPTNPVLDSVGATVQVYLGTSRVNGAGPVIPLPDPTGTIIVRRTSNNQVLATALVDHEGTYDLVLPPLPAGAVELTPEYSGDANFAAKTGDPAVLTVQDDVVEATGVTIGYTTFYPKKDGYRDTLPIKGVRNEPASVGIRIYNAKNALVKSLNVPMGSGAYSVSWNGRTSGGDLRPAGRYRVVQTLNDGEATLVISKTVSLSSKKLTFRTKTLTKLATALVSAGTALGGTVSVGSSSIRIDGRGSGWAGAGWQFRLPEAKLYDSVVIGAYGFSGVPLAAISAQNFKTCAYASDVWNISCFDRAKSLRTTKGWTSRTLATANRHGAVVRVAVDQFYGASRIYKVRVVVRYGVFT